MSWKFGVDASHSLQNVIPLFAALGGSYAFAATQTNSTGAGTALTTGGSPWASYMLGVVNGTVTLRNTEIPYYYRWEAIAGFVQNDWKIKRNLTLNLGVRYSLQMPRTEKYDNQGVYRLDMTSSVPLPTSADADQWRGDQVGAGAGFRVQRPGQLALPDAARLQAVRAALCLCLEPHGAAVAPPDAARRLRTFARSGDRRHAPAESGFRRHLGLCHHGSFHHREPELRDAPGRESSGADADHAGAGDRRPGQRCGDHQQPVLPAGPRRLRGFRQLPHAVRAELEPDGFLAGQQQHVGGVVLRGRQGNAPVPAA